MKTRYYSRSWRIAEKKVSSANKGYFSYLKDNYEDKLRCEISDGWIYLFAHPRQNEILPYLKTKDDDSIVIKNNEFQETFHDRSEPEHKFLLDSLVDETIPDRWSCNVCRCLNTYDMGYCWRCGYYENSFKRHHQYEEVSNLFKKFSEGKVSFPALLDYVQNINFEFKTWINESLVENRNELVPNDIKCHEKFLNELKGNYDGYKCGISLEDFSKFNVDSGVYYWNNGLGVFKTCINTIDHLTFIIDFDIDLNHGLQVAFPLESNFFHSLKVFLEYYKIELDKVWIQCFENELWPLPMYELWREDDNGNRYLMETFYIKSVAHKKCEHYLAKAHKQDYWVKEITSTEGFQIKCANHKDTVTKM